MYLDTGNPNGESGKRRENYSVRKGKLPRGNSTTATEKESVCATDGRHAERLSKGQ
jgi:hypothetical protein